MKSIYVTLTTQRIVSFFATIELQTLVYLILCYVSSYEAEKEDKSVREVLKASPKSLLVVLVITGMLLKF